MKRLIVVASIIVMSMLEVSAQKLVIGAKMPDLKGIQWLSAAPSSGRVVYVDFFQSTNATCQQNLTKIEALKSKFPNMVVVVLTRENGDAITELVKKYGSKFSIGYDADGKKHDAFGVKFVPFSMVFSAKGLLAWQGNVSQLTESQLKNF